MGWPQVISILLACGIRYHVEGVETSLRTEPSRSDYVIARNSDVTVKCFATIVESEEERTACRCHVTYVVRWTNDGIPDVLKDKRRQLNNHTLSSTLRLVHTVDKFFTKATCELWRFSDAQAEELFETKSVIFTYERLPEKPTNLDTCYMGTTLVTSFLTHASAFAYHSLNTSHKIKSKGVNCSQHGQDWITSTDCFLRYIDGDTLIVCAASTKKRCSVLNIVIEAKNKYGTAKSNVSEISQDGDSSKTECRRTNRHPRPPFVQEPPAISDTNRGHGALRLVAAKESKSEVKLEIHDSNTLFGLIGNIYKIRYVDAANISKELVTRKNAKAHVIRGLRPAQCVFVSVASKLVVSGRTVDQFEWGSWNKQIKVCSKPLVIRQSAYQLTCLQEPDQPAVLLHWKSPNISDAFGSIGFNLNIRSTKRNRTSNEMIGYYSSLTNRTYNGTTDDTTDVNETTTSNLTTGMMFEHSFLSWESLFASGGLFEFGLSICNRVGCGESTSCTALVAEPNVSASKEEEPISEMWILLSVIIPIGTILSLGVFIFVSYTIKMQIKEDLGFTEKQSKFSKSPIVSRKSSRQGKRTIEDCSSLEDIVFENNNNENEYEKLGLMTSSKDIAIACSSVTQPREEDVFKIEVLCETPSRLKNRPVECDDTVIT